MHACLEGLCWSKITSKTSWKFRKDWNKFPENFRRKFRDISQLTTLTRTEIELCQVERNSFRCSRKVRAAAAALSKHWACHRPPCARRYCQEQVDGGWSCQLPDVVLQLSVVCTTRLKPCLHLRFVYDTTTIRLRRIARACFHSSRFDSSKNWTCQFFVVVVS